MRSECFNIISADEIHGPGYYHIHIRFYSNFFFRPIIDRTKTKAPTGYNISHRISLSVAAMRLSLIISRLNCGNIFLYRALLECVLIKGNRGFLHGRRGEPRLGLKLRRTRPAWGSKTNIDLRDAINQISTSASESSGLVRTILAAWARLPFFPLVTLEKCKRPILPTGPFFIYREVYMCVNFH